MSKFLKIEKKWQKKWEDAKVFKVKESSKNKFYVLEMFPYPSGSGLHMGHALNYSIGDIYARFKRMQGFNVLYPMGYDSFGLPAENAAIKAKTHPKKYTDASTKDFTKQMKALGLSYDWDRTLKTSDPEYYKWNQFFFLKFLEKGLVYRKKSIVNWCPKCDTVLANEQVHNGKCWRHETTDVKEKFLEQWFIKTTAYAEELLKDIEKLDWPERIKIMQRNWIGKSEGTEIIFKINNKSWPIFTTRPDTIYGVTFMVVSAQHPKLWDLVTEKNKKQVQTFLKKTQSLSEKDKEGVFTGSYAVNPINKEKIPVYAGNFVLASYGSGMVMAVPAHDNRDYDFAKKYNLPIRYVIKGNSQPYTKDGVLINSNKFNNLNNNIAKDEITNHLKEAKKITQYKLRDWLVSRQRYWGTPIPMINCKDCGYVQVPEKQLPVKLPDKVKFGKGNPLETNEEFINVKCPKCKSNAKRETDTLDTFFDSSWYFLRYCDPKNNKLPFDKKKVNYWLPVDQYIGGAEHACMHLIYARFFTKALRDLKYIKIDEPFQKLFNQGMLHKDGFVMAKSRGNGILPEEVSKKCGIDTARFFLMSLASPDKDTEWNDKGLEGTHKFIKRVMEYCKKVKIGKSSKKLESNLNKTIEEVTNNIENFEYNIATIKLRQLFESLENTISKKDLETFLILLHPFCPHITEELNPSKTFLSLQKWPKVNKKKINLNLEFEDSLIESTTHDINKIINLLNIKPKKITLFIAEDWKYSFIKQLKKEIQTTRDMSLLIKKLIIKGHEREIAKLIPSFIRDANKIPKIVLSPKKESEILKKINFKPKIKISYSKTSKELKAKQSLPGKPSIIIE